jgi:AcrR family transcriptional regulator
MTRSQYLTRSQDFESTMSDNLPTLPARIPLEALHPEDHPCATEPTGRRERRRQETRERLFEAAVRLLSEREFEAVTVEAITEAADVGKGTFFNYFSSKEAVVGYFFEYKSARLLESARRVNEADSLPASFIDDLPGGPIWQKMLRVFSLCDDGPKDNQRMTRTLLSLVLTNVEVRRAYEVMMHRIGNLTRGFIEEAQRSGEVRTDLTAEQIVCHLHMVHLGAVSYWAYSETPESMEQMLHRSYRVLWEGVAHREKSDHIPAIAQPAST